MVPVFAGGLDFSLPVRKFFYDPLGSGKAFVECVVSLTGFALVGGPARQDAPKVPAVTLDLSIYPPGPISCLLDHAQRSVGVIAARVGLRCPAVVGP